MEDLKIQILPYLTTGFEKALFEAALYNIRDSNNKLRLNNFAYATRELTRHFLERLAPDDQVRNAPWFKIADQDRPTMITREQRIKYAVQGYLSDDYREKVLHLDLQEMSKTLRDSIGDLSKYTHVNPDTFDVDGNTIDDISLSIMTDTLRFFMTVNEAQLLVEKAVDTCIDKEMVSQFYIETHNELDILATHHEVLSYLITDLIQVEKDEETVTMQAKGFVNVRLQYGSDGDIRRDDGFKTEMRFPFSSEFVASYKNQDGDIHIVSSALRVENESWFE